MTAELGLGELSVEKKGLGESIMKDHESKRGNTWKIRATACGKLRRYMRVISSHFPRHIIASLRQVDVSSLTPLPVKKRENWL